MKYFSSLSKRFCSSAENRNGCDDKFESADKKWESTGQSGPGDVNGLLQSLKEGADQLTRQLNVSILKAEFERDFRPFLAASALLLPGGLLEVTPAFAHGQLYGLNKEEPVYLTALDVMIRAIGFDPQSTC